MWDAMQDAWDPDGADERARQRQRDLLMQDNRAASARNRMAPGAAQLFSPYPAIAAEQQRHFGAFNDAVGAVNSAISGEMQSRVNQAREARRMEHERQLAQIRAQSDMYGAAIRSLLG